MNCLHELFGEIIARAACNVIVSYSLNIWRLKFHLHFHQEHIRGPWPSQNNFRNSMYHKKNVLFLDHHWPGTILVLHSFRMFLLDILKITHSNRFFPQKRIFDTYLIIFVFNFVSLIFIFMVLFAVYSFMRDMFVQKTSITHSYSKYSFQQQKLCVAQFCNKLLFPELLPWLDEGKGGKLVWLPWFLWCQIHV